MKNAKPFLLWLGDEQRDRIAMIQAVYPVSKSDVLRLSLSAACRELGFEKEPDVDLLKKR